MMFKLKKKNNLDEFQEQKLLHIEKDGFWVLYVLLTGAMIVQMAMGSEFADVAGEWFCFMAASLLMVVRCVKNGLWDRRLKPDKRTNLITSVIAGAVTFSMTWLIFIRNYEMSVKSALVASGIVGGLTLLITYLVMSILAGIYKRRLQQLEEKEE